MKKRRSSNLEVLESFALLVLSLVSTFPRSGSVVIDGNFSAEHLKMRRPEGDIALSPGGRYMVEPKRYELHLNTGKEIKQVCLFREINFNSNMIHIVEITVFRSQGSQSRQYLPSTPHINRNWCSCMCTTWVFFSQ